VDDFAPLIERAFCLEINERSYPIENIEGAIPAFIEGTYYLNGPARFSRGGLNYHHWLDGDGMVCALRINGALPHFTNRFVRSAKFVAEEQAGHALFRAFGTAFEGDRLKRGSMLESPVNVSVYTYGQTLLAFGEQGLPVELDAVTLQTRGEFDFGGALNDLSPFAGHPKFDRASGEMFNFGVAFSATEPCLNLYRFNRQGKLHHRKRIQLEFACSVHDFGLSANYAVFYLSPYILRIAGLVRESRSLMDSLSWEPERGSRLLIASRDSGEPLAIVPIGNRYCLHLVNCFEEETRLMIDVIELDRPIYDQYQAIPNLFTHVCGGRPVRFTVDTQSWRLVDRKEIDYRLAPDFPSIDPRKFAKAYCDFWMLGISKTGKNGRKFFDQLVHANWAEQEVSDVYQAPPEHYLAGEPIFIGDPRDKANGAVICQVFDAQRVASTFAIFDAFNVARGPIALLPLNEPIHLGFHASFSPEDQGL